MVMWLPNSILPRDVQATVAIAWVVLVASLALQQWVAVVASAGVLWVISITGAALNG